MDQEMEGEVVFQADRSLDDGGAGELDERGYGEDCVEDAFSIWSHVVKLKCVIINKW